MNSSFPTFNNKEDAETKSKHSKSKQYKQHQLHVQVTIERLQFQKWRQKIKMAMIQKGKNLVKLPNIVEENMLLSSSLMKKKLEQQYQTQKMKRINHNAAVKSSKHAKNRQLLKDLMRNQNKRRYVLAADTNSTSLFKYLQCRPMMFVITVSRLQKQCNTMLEDTKAMFKSEFNHKLLLISFSQFSVKENIILKYLLQRVKLEDGVENVVMKIQNEERLNSGLLRKRSNNGQHNNKLKCLKKLNIDLMQALMSLLMRKKRNSLTYKQIFLQMQCKI